MKYIRSRFGADLDNVCDAVAHVALALAVGAHFGGMVLMLSTVAAGSAPNRLRIAGPLAYGGMRLGNPWVMRLPRALGISFPTLENHFFVLATAAP